MKMSKGICHKNQISICVNHSHGQGPCFVSVNPYPTDHHYCDFELLFHFCSDFLNFAQFSWSLKLLPGVLFALLIGKTLLYLTNFRSPESQDVGQHCVAKFNLFKANLLHYTGKLRECVPLLYQTFLLHWINCRTITFVLLGMEWKNS